MRTRVNRLVTLGAALAALTSLPAYGDPADSRAPEDTRWAPAFALTGGFTAQQQESSVESFDVLGNWVKNKYGITPSGARRYPGKLRPAASGVDHVASPYVGASVELMTPAITLLPGRLRVFVTGEILPTFSTVRKIASEADPTGAHAPIKDTGEPYQNIDFPEEATAGVGSETRSEIQRGVWAAGIGIAFPFEFKGRQLRVKPSFGWLRYEVDVDGLVEDSIKDDWNKPASFYYASQSGPHLRAITLAASVSQAFDSIGPGLELEMDVGRWGPLQPCLFFNANAYRVLGDRTLEFESRFYVPAERQYEGFWPPPTPVPTDPCYKNPTTPQCWYDHPNHLPREIFGSRQNVNDPLGDNEYAGVFRHEVHPWMFRMGVGLRFRWVGN